MLLGLCAVSAGVSAEGLAPESRAALDAVLGVRPFAAGKVEVTVPKLAENGLSVPLSVRVESPMTAASHVRTVHVVAPVNPTPTVARFHFTPASGEAFVKTRIRLADSQDIIAVAETSDGHWWLGSAHVVVTLGGCLDPVL